VILSVGLRNASMNAPLRTFYEWFWISLLMALPIGVLLFVVSQRREAWLRYVAAEASFWVRIGVPRSVADFSRRFEESRAFTKIVAILFAALLLLSALHGFFYVHFKGKIQHSQPNPAAAVDAPITSGSYLVASGRRATDHRCSA
jgi:hypothetical protein